MRHGRLDECTSQWFALCLSVLVLVSTLHQDEGTSPVVQKEKWHATSVSTIDLTVMRCTQTDLLSGCHDAAALIDWQQGVMCTFASRAMLLSIEKCPGVLKLFTMGLVGLQSVRAKPGFLQGILLDLKFRSQALPALQPLWWCLRLQSTRSELKRKHSSQGIPSIALLGP